MKKGDRWFYSGQYLGYKYHSRAIYHSKSDCLKAEREKLSELDKMALSNSNDMALLELFNLRLDNIKANKSLKYYEENRRFYKQFLDFTGHVSVSEVSKPQVYKFLTDFSKELRNRGRGNWKVNSCIRVLKAAFNEAINIYEIDMKNPFTGIQMFPVDIKTKYIPPDDDIDAVRNICTLEERLLIDFVDATACRIMEAIRLNYIDINNDKLTLYTRKSKNSNLTPRIIPKPDWLKNSGKGKVFKTWDASPRFLERRVAKLKQRRWNWHSLRHRRASIWANDGMSLIELQHRLGHSNMETTQRYCQLLGFNFR